MTTSQQVGVLQLTDTLAAGGLERVAVNLGNLLPANGYRSFVGTTRAEGVLAGLMDKQVGRVRLDRKKRFDLAAVHKLRAYLKMHHIQIVHAHGSAILMANLATIGTPKLHLVWHDHFGRYATESRPEWLFRLLTRRTSGVIAVNKPLLKWSRERLRLPQDRVWYLPNFVVGDQPRKAAANAPALPGRAGNRIVCVANLRRQKDHLNLISAMRTVVRSHSYAQLICVGTCVDHDYAQLVKAEVARAGLERNVTFWGPCEDVPGLLAQCDIGVLSSSSEGLPLSLLEYGEARLPTVVTNVGQCAEVLDHGRVGRVVPPRDSLAMAQAIIGFLDSEQERAEAGAQFGRHVRTHHSPQAAMRTLDEVYRFVLESNKPF